VITLGTGYTVGPKTTRRAMCSPATVAYCGVDIIAGRWVASRYASNLVVTQRVIGTNDQTGALDRVSSASPASCPSPVMSPASHLPAECWSPSPSAPRSAMCPASHGHSASLVICAASAARFGCFAPAARPWSRTAEASERHVSNGYGARYLNRYARRHNPASSRYR
jgi:hypothetical protein